LVVFDFKDLIRVFHWSEERFVILHFKVLFDLLEAVLE
jgi:hypothetical protein